jgi:PTH1 family peptidyl-tRNA hydrolase
MLLLVGLGNPGSKYSNNRHNIGFMVVDEIIHRHGFGPARRKFQGDICEGRIGAEKVLILKPNTFMNESGLSVGEAAQFYKLAPEDIVIIHDELDLEAGNFRMKAGGGTAGNNGLKSLVRHLGPDFRRMRIGIGHPGNRGEVHAHVLKDFSKLDREWVDPMIDAIAKNIDLLVSDSDATFANKVHLTLHPPKPKPPRENT